MPVNHIPGAGSIFDAIRVAEKLMADIPPPPILAECRLFSVSESMHWEEGKQSYAVAHPAFWRRFTLSSSRASPYFGIAIYDIDDEANEDLRKKIMTSLSRALQRAGLQPESRA